ncbi:hypothetical protein FDP41_002812 [Naegleria fowleri]|uniref:SAM domain-containing protein n=1 Tax=Naegleria fowleri TaxID=5763 RepID=A0A6A5BMN6_NAEFO|nr:uncharacterized protein FDP41_002812 [Naegleria fowleri]KAF0978297.1 hypothetical protein FDP41_002812 [Naegleria fowleri]CAG4716188.1 unnamed protein product [Naegleria fowleri]
MSSNNNNNSTSSSNIKKRLTEYIDKHFDTNYVRDWSSSHVIAWMKLIGLDAFSKQFSKIKNLNGEYIYKHILQSEEYTLAQNFPFITKFGCLRKLYLQSLKLRKNLYHLDPDMVLMEVSRNPSLIGKTSQTTQEGQHSLNGNSGGIGGSLFTSVSRSFNDDDDDILNSIATSSSVSSSTASFVNGVSNSMGQNASFIEYRLLPSMEIANYLKRKKILTSKEHLSIITTHCIDGEVFLSMTTTSDWMSLFIYHYSNQYVGGNLNENELSKVYDQTFHRHPSMPNMEQVNALKNIVVVHACK